MSSKATGEKCVQFDYFEELDSIFGKDPIIKPVSTASTLQDKNEVGTSTHDNIKGTETSKRKSESENEKPPKISKLEKKIMEYKENVKAREPAKQRRHEENMEIKRDSLKVFKEYMDKLLEK